MEIESINALALIQNTIRELIGDGVSGFYFLQQKEFDNIAVGLCLIERLRGVDVEIVKTFTNESEMFNFLQCCMFNNFKVNSYPESYYSNKNRKLETYMNIIEDVDLVLAFIDESQTRKIENKAVQYEIKNHKEVINLYKK